MDIKTGDACGCCGRVVSRIPRISKGIKYCAACYKREFVSRTCSVCEKTKRIHRKADPAVCESCLNHKPCIRCGKESYRLGKITLKGPVCNSCSVHFRESQKCDGCGVMSQRLSRVTRFGTSDRLCPKCATKDFENCPRCGKHRLLVISEDGEKICSRCLREGYIPCVKCGTSIPAGRGSLCSDCYHEGLLETRLTQNSEVFAHEVIRSHFSTFGNWLRQEVGAQKAALTISSYAPFFKDIENRWGCIPDYSELVQEYGVDYLRRRRIPVRWMSHSELIRVDKTLKAEVSGEQRVHRMLEDIKVRTPLHELLCMYRDECFNKTNGNTNVLKLLRLSLRPAIDFLLQSRAFPPRQSDLDRYLRKKPGQCASLHGFIIWFNQKEGLNLNPRLSPLRKKDLRMRKIVKSMQMIRDPELPNSKLAWLKLGLQYFHDFNRQALKMVKLSDFTKFNESYRFVLNGNEYWLPEYPHMTMVYPAKSL